MAEKEIVRTERAPAPFQGAPYNQAVKAAGSCSSPARSDSGPGEQQMVGTSIAEQTEQVMQNLARDPRGGRQRPRPARQDDRLPAEPRRLRGHERGLRAARRRAAARAVDGRGRQAPGGRARRDRGHRPPLNTSLELGRRLRALARPGRLRRRRRRPRRAARPARCREHDFVVPGVGHAELRAALEPHGRVEDLIVADQQRGRPLPAARPRCASTPAGGHRVRAAARRAVDRPRPARLRDRRRRRHLARGGHAAARLHDQRDRTPSRDRRAARPARRARGPRAARPPHDEPDELPRRPAANRPRPAVRRRSSTSTRTRTPCGRCASGRRRSGTSRPSGSAAGSPRTGWESCRSCCWAPSPRRPCGSRATRASSSISCPSSSRCSASTRRAATTTSRSTSTPSRSSRPQPTRARRSPSGSRPCCTTPASPRRRGAAPTAVSTSTRTQSSASGATRRSARSSPRGRCRACATRRGCARASAGSCASTCSASRSGTTAPRRRRFLHRHGDELAFDLLAHKRADLHGSGRNPTRPSTSELERLERFERTLTAELERPHRLDQLAVDGNDLIGVGFAPGPALGAALDHLLSCVIGDPGLNTREWLLAEAERELRG